MPGGPRLDAPGPLHHARMQRIERRRILRDYNKRTGHLTCSQKTAHSRSGAIVPTPEVMEASALCAFLPALPGVRPGVRLDRPVVPGVWLAHFGDSR